MGTIIHCMAQLKDADMLGKSSRSLTQGKKDVHEPVRKRTSDLDYLKTSLCLVSTHLVYPRVLDALETHLSLDRVSKFASEALGQQVCQYLQEFAVTYQLLLQRPRRSTLVICDYLKVCSIPHKPSQQLTVLAQHTDLVENQMGVAESTKHDPADRTAAAGRKCTGCLYMIYCSRGCQKADWTLMHRHECACLKGMGGSKPFSPPANLD